jgi:hypothetical protein
LEHGRRCFPVLDEKIALLREESRLLWRRRCRRSRWSPNRERGSQPDGRDDVLILICEHNVMAFVDKLTEVVGIPTMNG